MALVDNPNPSDASIFIRGNSGNPGPKTPRQFVTILTEGEPRPFSDGSGRLELAKAIASRDNPLTARVLVNRVWLGHFGMGLVRTPSDFGFRGDPPTHPELLDFLATRFMADGWSIKKLHRLIMLSSAYQQSSADNAAARSADPENTRYWRMNRRRLDFEATRDALLFVSGRLDTTMGGQAVDIVREPFSTRRTLYGFVDRQNLPGMFRAFDFASPDAHSPQRFFTTVPQQALFMMNSPFVAEQARQVAADPAITQATADPRRVQILYQRLYGRDPLPDETQAGVDFLASAKAGAGINPIQQYAQALLLANEFVFVD
jgi:Protein of unknown function (DUF1553)